MKTRRFDFNWRPLQVQISLSVEGSVPDRQNYNADTGEYTPDYTLTPLILQPNVSILDKDEVLSAGRVNASLTNIRWTENLGGQRKLIDTGNADYEITSSGSDAGRLRVRRNVEPKIPLTLEFYAEYIDPRTSQIVVIRGSYQVACDNAANAVRVELDAAGQTLFNPLTDPHTQRVTATVWVADRVATSDKYLLTWEIMGEDGTWHEAGADEVMDYAVTVEDNAATVDRWLMGASLALRCRCRYSEEGTPEEVALTEASPQAQVTFVRRIPKFEFDIVGVPYNIPAGLRRIFPQAVIRTTNGEVANPSAEVLPLWYIATNKAAGSLTYALVAHGASAEISTSALDSNLGAVVGLDVVDRGPAGAFTDAQDGAVLCDADGAVLIIH